MQGSKACDFGQGHQEQADTVVDLADFGVPPRPGGVGQRRPEHQLPESVAIRERLAIVRVITGDDMRERNGRLLADLHQTTSKTSRHTGP